ncbi:MAG: hypothetical protein ACR2LK_00750, partial [Solirubrobacteraceae bacterium]
QRQLCLAHLLRDFVALGERAGAPGRLGRALARVLGDVFTTLNAPGRDPSDLSVLIAFVQLATDDPPAKPCGPRHRDRRARSAPVWSCRVRSGCR